VAKAYGLEAIFDADYQPGPAFRFQLAGADYREALHALEAATASFATPLTERLFLVAKDSAQKRVELELTATVAIPLPETVAPQEAQEMARAVQQALQIVRVMVDTTRRIVLLRDRVSRIGPAQELFRQLLRPRAEVAIEVEFLEIGELSSTSFGLSLQTLFPLAYFGEALNSKPSIPSGFARFLTFGGGKSLFGFGVTDASVFARMSRSHGRSLLKTVVRSTNGQEASLHVGDKFPIVTSTFLVQGGEDFPSFPPAFNFEDLGLVLKVKPAVHGAEEVSLEIEAEFKVLTGEAVNAIPVVANRKLQSQMRLRNREWAAVAGLMSASEARSITGPAGLSQLPVVGSLLRESNRTSDSKTVLLLLRPTVLSLPPGEDATQAVFLGAELRPRTPL
jgi:type II secretory pathway component GspD/PulD (secretin)